ncbi:MAG: hypothetical protein EOO16_16045 [Chitinophagaceae bacterium]|nr:MAG: hypothetical protein EOO16_16045 [Chitinophagaceae bacterium]
MASANTTQELAGVKEFLWSEAHDHILFAGKISMLRITECACMPGKIAFYNAAFLMRLLVDEGMPMLRILYWFSCLDISGLQVSFITESGCCWTHRSRCCVSVAQDPWRANWFSELPSVVEPVAVGRTDPDAAHRDDKKPTLYPSPM